ncbi:allantoinase AllB [Bacillus alkalicellulosilyticus]|uniref:allantoinase AllB n=1 Tax=Alkalihalobacterium alkalicellulosilyticum TaxID=1912214 RepID=UPI000996D9F6|nr:allantoinase AllB [Bacillus alkalicellulosilyticus]
MEQLLIKNGIVLVDDSLKNAQISVNGGVVTDISPHKQDESRFTKVIDATDSYVLPGFIDTHVHFNDPGREEWEGFLTGSQAAAAGGITSVFDMPLNSSPAVVDVSILEKKRNHVQTKAFIDYGFWGGITSENIEKEETLIKMKESGVAGFKAFLSESGIDDFPCLPKSKLKKAMQICKKLGKVLALHAEDNELIKANTDILKESKRVDREAFLESRPLCAEDEAIEHALQIVKEVEAMVHFVHVSSPTAIQKIFEMKEQGFNVSAEVCPHYLLFTDDDFRRRGPLLKCAPPLRNRKVVEELWQCIQNGWVDLIGTDHSPCLFSMKHDGEKDIWKAWGGIQGIQFGFAFFVSEALKREIPLTDITSLLSTNAAQRFGLKNKKGRIAIGTDADFTIFNKQLKKVVTKSDILTKNKYSPYEGMKMKGMITATIVRGRVIYQDGEIRASKAEGREVGLY